MQDIYTPGLGAIVKHNLCLPPDLSEEIRLPVIFKLFVALPPAVSKKCARILSIPVQLQEEAAGEFPDLLPCVFEQALKTTDIFWLEMQLNYTGDHYWKFTRMVSR